jgi:hypothetical protein
MSSKFGLKNLSHCPFSNIQGKFQNFQTTLMSTFDEHEHLGVKILELTFTSKPLKIV